VKLHDAVAFVLRGPYKGQTAEKRAADATKALANAFVDATPDDVHVEMITEQDPGATTPTTVAYVYVGKTPIVQLTQDDAILAGDATTAVYADSVAADVRKVIRAEKERSAIASRVFSISLVVFFFVVMIYLVRRIGELAERANNWVEANPDRIPALRVRSLEVINPAALRSALALTLSIVKWLAQFGIVYVWLIAALSLFESTRGYTTRLTGFIIEPFASLASRVATTLPITMVVVFGLIAIAILLRVVGLFFESVASNTTTLSWLPPELARPTSILVRAGIVLSALVFAAPLVTGNAEGALPRVGLIAIIALGLSAVPLLACAFLGAVAVFGRRVRVGEFVELGGRVGKVMNVSLIDLSIEDDDGVEVRFPHFLWLVKPLRLLGALPRVAVRVTVERKDAGVDLHEKLLKAIESAGVEPRVDIEAIGPTAVEIVASALTEDLDAKNRMFLLLLEVLNEKKGDQEAKNEQKP